MTDMKKQIDDDIDLFDAIEIILKRKILLISIIVVSILLSSVYVYIFVDEKPRTYSISTGFNVRTFAIHNSIDSLKDMNEVLQKSIDAFKVKVGYWFLNDFYKADVQEKMGLQDIPKVKVNPRGLFVDLKMRYPIVETGKKIIKVVMDSIVNSDITKEVFGIVNGIYEMEVDRRHLKLKEIMNTIEEKQNLLSRQKFDIENTDKSIVNLKSRMKQLNNQKQNLFSGNTKEAILTELYDNYHDTIIEFIVYLENQKMRIESMNKTSNLQLFELRKEQKIQQTVIDILNQKKIKLKDIFEFEKIYYEPIFDNKISKMRILGFSTVLGIFFGILIAFILGLRDRRLLQKT